MSRGLVRVVSSLTASYFRCVGYAVTRVSVALGRDCWCGELVSSCSPWITWRKYDQSKKEQHLCGVLWRCSDHCCNPTCLLTSLLFVVQSLFNSSSNLRFYLTLFFAFDFVYIIAAADDVFILLNISTPIFSLDFVFICDPYISI